MLRVDHNILGRALHHFTAMEHVDAIDHLADDGKGDEEIGKPELIMQALCANLDAEK